MQHKDKQNQVLGSGEAAAVSQSNHTSENKLINIYVYILTNCYLNIQHIHSLLIILVFISALPCLLKSHIKHFFTELFYISMMFPGLLPSLHNPSQMARELLLYTPRDTFFYTRWSAIHSLLCWLPSSAEWCCFGRHRSGRSGTPCTYKKRVSCPACKLWNSKTCLNPLQCLLQDSLVLV